MRNKYAKISNPNEFVSDPGSPIHLVFEPKVLPNGEILLTEVGKEDIQAYIDSFRDQTDMAYILRQLQLGDNSVLSSGVPYFGDFTDMPDTYAEALQLVINAENKFNKLPLDVRNKFDNDYRKWFATSGNPEWIEKMSDFIKISGDDLQPVDNSSVKVVDSNEKE